MYFANNHCCSTKNLPQQSVGPLIAPNCSNKLQFYKTKILFVACPYKDIYIKYTSLKCIRISKI